MPLQAKIIKDSVSVCGSRLTTFEVEFHRFILPEINTHRLFSRNYQSSRAIPVERQIEMVMSDPALPVHWGKNQPGMKADNECDNLVCYRDNSSGEKFADTRDQAWLEARDKACEAAQYFHEAGYHKQIVNRLIEPFMFTRGVITGTDYAFNNFFTLRCHKDAQPEIQALAKLMREEYRNSVPEKLNQNEWHLPYVDSTEGTPENIRVSVSCCAQVSYRRLDDSQEKADRIYSNLNLDNLTPDVFLQDMSDKLEPGHASPCEHQARVDDPFGISIGNIYNGNFSGCWAQYRKIIGG